MDDNSASGAKNNNIKGPENGSQDDISGNRSDDETGPDAKKNHSPKGLESSTEHENDKNIENNDKNDNHPSDNKGEGNPALRGKF
jgi:hypothetical protein